MLSLTLHIYVFLCGLFKKESRKCQLFEELFKGHVSRVWNGTLFSPIIILHLIIYWMPLSSRSPSDNCAWYISQKKIWESHYENKTGLFCFFQISICIINGKLHSPVVYGNELEARVGKFLQQSCQRPFNLARNSVSQPFLSFVTPTAPSVKLKCFFISYFISNNGFNKGWTTGGQSISFCHYLPDASLVFLLIFSLCLFLILCDSKHTFCILSASPSERFSYLQLVNTVTVLSAITWLNSQTIIWQ